MTIEQFTNAYITAALWASCDNDGEPMDSNYDKSDIAPKTLEKMKADCADFYSANASDIQCDNAPMSEYWDRSSEQDRKADMAGHDFWLTRCGTGAGFWDGKWPEPQATRLTDASQAFGNVDLYIGDDGKVWA